MIAAPALTLNPLRKKIGREPERVRVMRRKEHWTKALGNCPGDGMSLGLASRLTSNFQLPARAHPTLYDAYCDSPASPRMRDKHVFLDSCRTTGPLRKRLISSDLLASYLIAPRALSLAALSSPIAGAPRVPIAHPTTVYREPG